MPISNNAHPLWYIGNVSHRPDCERLFYRQQPTEHYNRFNLPHAYVLLWAFFSVRPLWERVMLVMFIYHAEQSLESGGGLQSEISEAKSAPAFQTSRLAGCNLAVAG
jgi:hypothetical protein